MTLELSPEQADTLRALQANIVRNTELRDLAVLVLAQGVGMTAIGGFELTGTTLVLTEPSPA